jgi:hypothetical protein
MRRSPIIAAGLLALLAAVAVAGAHSSRHLQGTNHLRPLSIAAGMEAGQTACQAGEEIPAGTGGVGLWATADGKPVPALTVTVAGLGRGALRAGRPEGPVEVDLPVAERTLTDAEVCVRNDGPGTVFLLGEQFAPPTAMQLGGAPQPGRARIQYLEPGEASWWGIAGDLARRIAGARNAFPGAATPYLWVLLALAAAAGAVALVRRPRRTGWGVAAVVAVNALAWGLLIPPYHVPDEPSHAFYAQYLGETGKLPRVTAQVDWFSKDLNGALAATSFYYVIGRPDGRPAWTVRLAPETDRTGTGNASTASSNPPLYYVAQAAVYRAVHGLGVMDRLAFMRMLSALLGGLTALCVFAFLRELVPDDDLPATTGALLAGLMPQFAFITAGVNNDAALYLVSAALFLALARVLRRGLSVRRALACGLLLGAGVLVKTQMLAFAPAVVLALLLARGPRRALAVAAGAVAAPLAL